MNETEAQTLAHELMAKHGLISTGWSFNFNKKKRSMGMCRYRTKQREA